MFNLYPILDTNLYVPIPLNNPTASTNTGKIIDYIK